MFVRQIFEKTPVFGAKKIALIMFFGHFDQKKTLYSNFSVISVVPIGIDPFLDLNGQNSNFENYKFISDPFYIRVNDWLATAEPSMDIFWHLF